jgi:DNA mismatch endonuclease, patch repair protein
MNAGFLPSQRPAMSLALDASVKPKELVPDRLSPSERSQHMRRIRKVDTRAEIIVRRLIHSMGFRFRLHRRDLPGTPDIVMAKTKKVVLVHGCFWHQHAGCRLARLPKTRLDYWLPKLARNAERDRQAEAALGEQGWSVLVVWECEVANLPLLARKLSLFLGLPTP